MDNRNSLRIGTSGYSYKDWEGVFYPHGLPASERLAYYSGHFETVEINATYYRILPASSFEKMASSTPDGFEFIIKANQDTTHQRSPGSTAVSELLESVRPLIEQKRFSGFLAQFPYSFKNNQANRSYLAKVREQAGNHPLFVEFRHESWVDPPLFDFLKYHQISYVNVDQPKLKGLLPSQDILTTDLAYIRFHGRNSANWWGGTNETRYDYKYNEAELAPWLQTVLKLIRNSVRGYVFFNNHPQGNAVTDAKAMIRLLKKHTSD